MLFFNRYVIGRKFMVLKYTEVFVEIELMATQAKTARYPLFILVFAKLLPEMGR